NRFEIRPERAIHDSGATLAPGIGAQHGDGFARVLLLAGDRLHPKLDQGRVAGNGLRHGPASRGAVVAEGQETAVIVGEPDAGDGAIMTSGWADGIAGGRVPEPDFAFVAIAGRGQSEGAVVAEVH